MTLSAERYLDAVETNALLVFGLLLLCGVLGGMLANRIKWMPTITAFMLLGFVIGPHGLGMLTKKVVMDSSIIIDVALGLILYKLGNMLHPRMMLKSRKLMLTSVAESLLSFVFVFWLVIALGLDAVLAAFVGAIAVSSSPSVLVHVSDELGAKGPVTERAKSLVAINNLVSFLIFSMILPFGLANGEESFGAVFLMPMYRLVGATLMGVAVGWAAIRIARMLREKDEHYRFAIVIGAVTLTLGLAKMLHTSALFAPLILGMATRWFETSRHNLSRVGLGEGGDLFYIVLFVMAGAKINPGAVLEAGIVPVLLVLVRSCGKVAGVFCVAPWTGFSKVQSAALSLLLIPMAGMAIGLATATSRMVEPELGRRVSTIVFAMVAIFETIGPFAAAHAFRIAGEVGKTEEQSGG